MLGQKIFHQSYGLNGHKNDKDLQLVYKYSANTYLAFNVCQSVEYNGDSMDSYRIYVAVVAVAVDRSKYHAIHQIVVQRLNVKSFHLDLKLMKRRYFGVRIN